MFAAAQGRAAARDIAGDIVKKPPVKYRPGDLGFLILTAHGKAPGIEPGNHCVRDINLTRKFFVAHARREKMNGMNELFQSADWKSEKHVPMIELHAPGKGEFFRVSVSVGREIPHPNTSAHHIAWIELYFQPEGEKFPCQVGRVEFCAHGAGLQGSDTGSVYTGHESVFSLKTDKPGTVLAASYCNIHGLWQGSSQVTF